MNPGGKRVVTPTDPEIVKGPEIGKNPEIVRSPGADIGAVPGSAIAAGMFDDRRAGRLPRRTSRFIRHIGGERRDGHSERRRTALQASSNWWLNIDYVKIHHFLEEQ